MDEVKPLETASNATTDSSETVEIVMNPEEITSDNIQSITCQTDNCNQVFTDINAFEEHVKTGHLEVKPKHPGGRPCEYCKRKEEIDKITREYIQSARDKKGTKDGFVPYQQELADMLDVDGDTVYQWTIKTKDDNSLEHEEFTGLIKKLNNFKELMLLKRTMGRYNPTGAIFQLKTKHGYMETDKRVLAGDSKDPIEIIITEEDRKKDGE